jgi:glutathione S-transferase
MSVVLYHHPFSRAAGTLWMLEEVDVDYELRFVDILAGEQKTPEILALNPMGKLPILIDGDAVVTESCAIGLYLADRYAPGRLAPRLDDQARGTYLRWSCFSPSVIEPGVMAKKENWTFREGAAGWGSYAAMIGAMEGAIARGPFLLGEMFSMADVIFGGTVRYLTTFGLLEARPAFRAYIERIVARPAFQRAEARNEEVRKARGITIPG